jgi:alpha-L-rhamnosidase
MGEVYDARLEAKVKNWNKLGFNDSNWKPVSKLDFTTRLIGGDENTAYLSEDLRIKPKTTNDTYIYDPEKVNFTSGLKFGEVIPEKVNPAKEIKLAKGKKLMIDLEQNIAGLAGLSVSGKTGTRITMRGAEMLNDGKNNPKVEKGGSCGPKGTLYWTGLSRGRSSEDNWYTDVYYMNDEPVQNYRASFTFHGFRYLEIYADNDIVLQHVYAQPITSVLKQAGKIATNNKNVNQLFSNILWSQMGNHITIPTDCPNRSERLGWSGDIVVFGETALYNFDEVNFMNNYMDISANYAKNNGGHLGTTMPGMNSGQGSTNAGWTDVGITLAWALYQQTGDISILEKNYALLSNYMNMVIKDGLKPGYGDWVALQATSATYMAGAYQMYDAFLMAKIANILGRFDDGTKFTAEYERMKKVLGDKYVDVQGNVLSVSADKVQRGGFLQPDILLDNSQTSILWALKLGLNKSETEKNVFIKNLLKNIDNEGGKERSNATGKTLSTGFLGINVFLPTLTENGLNNSAYDLLLQDKMPSWLYEVKNNATTTWERWNAYSTETSFEDYGMNSFNHYAYGAVGEWMYEYMLGIQKDEANPGFKNVILQPTPDFGKSYNDQARISQVDGSYDSYYGTIKSSWKTDGTNLNNYETVIPANTTATLYLPVNQLTSENVESTLKNIQGLNFIGITQKNGLKVAEIKLKSGGYNFEFEGGKLVANLLNGYVK